MLKEREICSFYWSTPLDIPEFWNLSRKHIRIEAYNHRFIKLNKFKNRLNARELKEFCIRFTPLHVYFSVLNWLFPERVGKKYKANYCVPLNGEYVVDIDSNLLHMKHNHSNSGSHRICNECLEISKGLTLYVCERIEEYYSDIAIVFSGKRGFHIHVLDFHYKDWTSYNPKNPIKSHEVARFKLTKMLFGDHYFYNRSHFVLSVDPMRIITVPNSLNAESGLVCSYIGDRKDLESITTYKIIEYSDPSLLIYGYPEPAILDTAGDEIYA